MAKLKRVWLCSSGLTKSFPYRGLAEGTIVEDFGTSVIVRLINGKERAIDKNEVIIYD